MGLPGSVYDQSGFEDSKPLEEEEEIPASKINEPENEIPMDSPTASKFEIAGIPERNQDVPKEQSEPKEINESKQHSLFGSFGFQQQSEDKPEEQDISKLQSKLTGMNEKELQKTGLYLAEVMSRVRLTHDEGMLDKKEMRAIEKFYNLFRFAREDAINNSRL